MATPEWKVLALGVVLAAAGWLVYPWLVDTPESRGDAAGHNEAATDFWQRPGARSLGSGDMKHVTPATGPLAEVEAASQALARPQGFTLDPNGRLRLTRALRNKLDDSLGSIDGPVSPETLERARQKVRQELSGLAQINAMNVLERYTSYRNAAAEQQTRSTPPPALPNGMGVMGEVLELQRRSALRTQMLDADLREAFFGDEEALDRYRLTLLQLQTMPSLNESERAEQLKPLWQQLPIHLRAQIPAPGSRTPSE